MKYLGNECRGEETGSAHGRVRVGKAPKRSDS